MKLTEINKIPNAFKQMRICISGVSCHSQPAGDLAEITSRNNSYMVGDKLTFKCSRNTRYLSGQPEIECLESGLWSGESLSCTSMRCKVLDRLTIFQTVFCSDFLWSSSSWNECQDYI